MKKVIFILWMGIVLTVMFGCVGKTAINVDSESDSIVIQEVEEVENNKKIEEPEVEVSESIIEEVEQEIIKTECKASRYTVFDASNVNRSENIRLAMTSINNIVVKSGEEFSFNNVVGERTAERGYKEANVMIAKPGGGSDQILGIGGGICQVSSTLCMTCKELNLEITERRPHSSRVFYCSYDEEAMIDWGTSDFRFKNNLNEDIVIKMYFENIEESTINQKLVCEIW